MGVIARLVEELPFDIRARVLGHQIGLAVAEWPTSRVDDCGSEHTNDS
jgi:hypothetical protein